MHDPPRSTSRACTRKYRRLAQRNRDAVTTARWLSDQHQCEGRAEAYDIVAEELEGVLQFMEDKAPCLTSSTMPFGTPCGTPKPATCWPAARRHVRPALGYASANSFACFRLPLAQGRQAARQAHLPAGALPRQRSGQPAPQTPKAAVFAARTSPEGDRYGQRYHPEE